jgi:hypothetical protein
MEVTQDTAKNVTRDIGLVHASCQAGACRVRMIFRQPTLSKRPFTLTSKSFYEVVSGFRCQIRYQLEAVSRSPT